MVFKAGAGPFRFVDALDFRERQFHAFLELVDKPLDGGVHHAAKGQRSARAFFQRPQIAERVLLRTFAIVIHG